MTQTINLTEPTGEMTLYPIFADWDGIVRGAGQNSIVDENNNRIPYSGSGTDVLHGVNATCTEPYFIKVTDSLGEDGGVQFEKTSALSQALSIGETPSASILAYRHQAPSITPKQGTG